MQGYTFDNIMRDPSTNLFNLAQKTVCTNTTLPDIFSTYVVQPSEAMRSLVIESLESAAAINGRGWVQH